MTLLDKEFLLFQLGRCLGAMRASKDSAMYNLGWKIEEELAIRAYKMGEVVQYKFTGHPMTSKKDAE